MSALGQMNDKKGIFVKTLIDTDIFPYDVTDYDIVYMSIVNTGASELEVTLTYKDTTKGTGTIYVPNGQTFSANVYRPTSIDVSVGNTFRMALYERGVI